MYSNILPGIDASALLGAWRSMMSRKSRLFPLLTKAGTLRVGERLTPWPRKGKMGKKAVSS
eukprot:6007639-Prorocentrum_lima.AAC.1